MSERKTVAYETPAPHVARIVLDRPDARNAQDTRLLYELNAAFDRVARDDAMGAAFALHQLAHSHNMQVHGMPVDPAGLFTSAKAKT